MSAERVERVRSSMQERELESLLVTNLVNVRWLTGFTGTNGACVITPEEGVFLTDFRYVEQAEEQVGGLERVTAGRNMVADLAARLAGRAGFDDAHVTVKAHAKLTDALRDGVELVAASGLVEDLREIKDPGELESIGDAAKLATAALEVVLDRGIVGRTEREVALELEQLLRETGAEDPSFPAIVASGAHGALPHAEPRDVRIPAGTLVVIDWGARVAGMCSDCTRTIATGPLPDAHAEVYGLVRHSQAEALAGVRAGAPCAKVDGIARTIIEEAGHGERFGHGLGHGVGLEVHEGPRLAKTADGELRAGNVVSVEPGVYLPGEIGVRIEDLVAVTDTGADVFTSFPKELTTVD